MKIRKATQNSPVQEPAVDAAAIAIKATETEAIPAPSPSAFVYEYDDEAGTVDFELSDGTLVRLKSPTKKQLWAVTGWINSSGEDYRNDLMMMMKLAQVCVVKWGNLKAIAFDQMLEELEPADFKRLGAAVTCFRSGVEDFFKRLGMASTGAALSD